MEADWLQLVSFDHGSDLGISPHGVIVRPFKRHQRPIFDNHNVGEQPEIFIEFIEGFAVLRL